MEGLERIFVCGQTCGSRLLATGGGIDSAHLAEAKRGHVDIDVLVCAGVGNIGFVPDTH